MCSWEREGKVWGKPIFIIIGFPQGKGKEGLRRDTKTYVQRDLKNKHHESESTKAYGMCIDR
jgi:hypothetical protein